MAINDIENVAANPSSDGGKIDKELVHYRFAGEGTDSGAENRRCGTCAMFEAPSSCSLVSGVISAEGVCDRWEPRNTGSGGYTQKRWELPAENPASRSDNPNSSPEHEMSVKIVSVPVPFWRQKFSNECHNPGGEGGGQFCSSGGEGGAVGSSKPNSKKEAADYTPGDQAHMGPDLIGDKAVADTITRQSRVPGFEDFAGRGDRKALDEIVNRMASNLVDSADRAFAVNKDAALQHADWYPRANKWIEGVAASSGFSKDGFTAATAVLSPGADWSHNVAWAKNIADKLKEDPIVTKRDVDSYFVTRVAAWQVKVDKAAKAGKEFPVAKPEYPVGLEGKKLSELSDHDAAVAIRGMSDAPGGTVHQLGGQAGFGDPSKKAIPQSDDNLAKAVSVLRNPSTVNIDDKLGEAHKVRSFYNNLRDPLEDKMQEVTSDTHHFGVANAEPWGMGSPFIASGKSSITAAPSTGTTGIRGTYPLVVEATRRAAAIVNDKYGLDLKPNQLQSVVWEEHRANYPSTLRSNKTMTGAIDQAHSDRAAGKIDHAEELKRVEDARLKAGGPTLDEKRAWYNSDLKGEPRVKIQDIRKAAKSKEGK